MSDGREQAIEADVVLSTLPLPALVGMTTVVLALAALVAAWVPSRRAMGIEPATALRAE